MYGYLPTLPTYLTRYLGSCDYPPHAYFVVSFTFAHTHLCLTLLNFTKMVVRIPHSFSYFGPAARRWIPALSNAFQRPGAQSSVKANPLKSHFDIASWNMDYSSSRPL